MCTMQLWAFCQSVIRNYNWSCLSAFWTVSFNEVLSSLSVRAAGFQDVCMNAAVVISAKVSTE